MQLDSEIKRSLSTAGIGRRYHEDKLSNYPQSAAILEWAATPVIVRQKLRDGRGVILGGDDVLGRKFLYLMARTAVLSGVNSKVVSLHDLAQLVDSDYASYDQIDAYRSCDTLFISGFYAPGIAPELPISVNARYAVSNLLMRKFESNLAVCVQIKGTPREAETWWGSTLMQELGQACDFIEVAA